MFNKKKRLVNKQKMRDLLDIHLGFESLGISINNLDEFFSFILVKNGLNYEEVSDILCIDKDTVKYYYEWLEGTVKKTAQKRDDIKLEDDKISECGRQAKSRFKL